MVKLSTARNGDCTDTDLKLRSMLLVLEAQPPVVGVDANDRPLTLVAPEAAEE